RWPSCSRRVEVTGAGSFVSSTAEHLDVVGGDSPVAHPRGCRPRGGGMSPDSGPVYGQCTSCFGSVSPPAIDQAAADSGGGPTPAHRLHSRRPWVLPVQGPG